MKKIVYLLLFVLILSSCSSDSVTQSSYDELNAKYSELQEKFNKLSSDYEQSKLSTPSPLPVPEPSTLPTLEPIPEPTPEPTPQAEAIEVINSYKASDYIIFEVRNNSANTLEVHFDITLYKNDEVVSVMETLENAVNINGVTLVKAWTEDIDFDKFEWECEYAESYYASYPIDNISYEEISVKADKVIIKITNNGNEDVQFLQATVLFFKDGACVSYNEAFVTDVDYALKSGKSKNVEVESGYNNNYKSIKFDEYKVYYTFRVDQ